MRSGMSFLPAVTHAEYRGAHKIHVRFNDETERTIDFSAWLEGPVFEPLKDPAYFKRFFLDGGTIAWPNGADIAPETLYEYQEPSRSERTRGHATAAGNGRESRPGRARRRG